MYVCMYVILVLVHEYMTYIHHTYRTCMYMYVYIYLCMYVVCMCAHVPHVHHWYIHVMYTHVPVPVYSVQVKKYTVLFMVLLNNTGIIF